MALNPDYKNCVSDMANDDSSRRDCLQPKSKSAKTF